MTDAELDRIEAEAKEEAEYSDDYWPNHCLSLIAELRQTRQRLAGAERFCNDLDRIASLVGCSDIPTRPVSSYVEDVIKRLAEAEAERKRLREKDRESERFCKEMLCLCADGIHAVNSLPRTADDVTILPGMRLYPLHPLSPDEIDGGEDYAVVEMRAIDPFSGDDIEADQLMLNYSSKEAAALAAGREAEVK